jgi:hypothetical protein
MSPQAHVFSRQPNISLTLAHGVENNPAGLIRVSTLQLISYDQHAGFTRLRLLGGKVLEVKETTDQIDRLVRGATSSLALQ